MTSVKWSAISFLGVSALVTAGVVAFTACSSGDTSVADPVDDDSGNPSVDSDSGTTADQCTQNTRETVIIVSPACQARLENSCCSELVACFSIVPTNTMVDDCNQYTDCYGACAFKTDGSPETDPSAVASCETDCGMLSEPDVVTAYGAIVTCINANADVTNTCAP